MSQLMWMINFIPDSVITWIINIIIIASITGILVSYFIEHIPFVNIYRLPIQAIGIIVLAVGMYFKGQISADSVWMAKVAEMQEKVKLAEEESKRLNQELQNRANTKIAHIKDVQVKTKIVIKEVAKEIDNKCIINKDAIEILNSAAKGQIPTLQGKSK